MIKKVKIMTKSVKENEIRMATETRNQVYNELTEKYGEGYSWKELFNKEVQAGREAQREKDDKIEYLTINHEHETYDVEKDYVSQTLKNVFKEIEEETLEEVGLYYAKLEQLDSDKYKNEIATIKDNLSNGIEQILSDDNRMIIDYEEYLESASYYYEELKIDHTRID